MNLQAKTV